jgi:cyclohexanecarboxylate-CoA ligase
VIGAARPLPTLPRPWAGRRIPEMLEESARSWPDQYALIDGEMTVTFRQLHEMVCIGASELYQRGVREGDRVAFLMPQTWDHVVLLYAVMHIGAVTVPLNVTWESAEIAYALNAADVTHLIAGGSYREKNLAEKLSVIGIDRSDPDAAR